MLKHASCKQICIYICIYEYANLLSTHIYIYNNPVSIHSPRPSAQQFLILPFHLLKPMKLNIMLGSICPLEFAFLGHWTLEALVLPVRDTRCNQEQTWPMGGGKAWVRHQAAGPEGGSQATQCRSHADGPTPKHWLRMKGWKTWITCQMRSTELSRHTSKSSGVWKCYADGVPSPVNHTGGGGQGCVSLPTCTLALCCVSLPLQAAV